MTDDFKRQKIVDQEKDKHWIEVALQDTEIYGTLQLYRELEQARFLDMFKHKIHPELFDDFISLVDSVFDVRIPPLLTVLHHYRAFAKIEETDN